MLQDDRYANNCESPLHGLPVLVKGNIGTKDHMQTNGRTAVSFTNRYAETNDEKQLDLMHLRMQCCLPTQRQLSSSGSKD
jgi:hypothetical protein